MSGFLRQEFRELEVLNYITKLRFEGKLKPGVTGNTRYSLIKSFQQVYKDYCPQDVHSAIRWNKNDPILAGEPDDENFVWKKAGTEDNNTAPTKKRKREHDTNTDDVLALKNDVISNIKPPRKKRKIKEVDLHDRVRGMTWNENTWSCAYDSLLTILSHAYLTSTRKWNEKVANANQ
ncbi:hypothetical protein DENSPDRAFT_789485, partial [Dentipellis sp. KUC8613]